MNYHLDRLRRRRKLLEEWACSHPPDDDFPFESRVHSIPFDHTSKHHTLKQQGVKVSQLFPSMLGLHAVSPIHGLRPPSHLLSTAPSSGTVITYYEGIIMWAEEYESLPFHCGTAVSLELEAEKDLVIVGYPDSPCAIINDPRGSAKPTANCRINIDHNKADVVPIKGHCFIQLQERFIAIRCISQSRIPEGTELTVDYGAGFFLKEEAYCYWCSMKFNGSDAYNRCTMCKNHFHLTEDCLDGPYVNPAAVNSWKCSRCLRALLQQR